MFPICCKLLWSNGIKNRFLGMFYFHIGSVIRSLSNEEWPAAVNSRHSKNNHHTVFATAKYTYIYEYYLHSININEGFALCTVVGVSNRQTTKVLVCQDPCPCEDEVRQRKRGIFAQDNYSDYFFRICNGGSTIFLDCCTQAVDTECVLRYYYY